MIDTSEVAKDESYVHFGGVRIRVNGTGNLLMTFQNLDTTITAPITPLVMSSAPGAEPLTLSNYISQRAFLRIETQQLNETFRINRVIVYVKPIWSQSYGN
jgi:hypothetical protein